MLIGRLYGDAGGGAWLESGWVGGRGDGGEDLVNEIGQPEEKQVASSLRRVCSFGFGFTCCCAFIDFFSFFLSV